MGISTRVCSLLGIRHPLVLGGMGGGTNPELVAAVSDTGALGILGCTSRSPGDIAACVSRIRALTNRPFGLNLLVFEADEDRVQAVLAARPSVLSTAWAFADQDLEDLFARAHEVGAKVMHMVSTVPEAVTAVESGADVVVAQGTEGGGHVGLMGTMVLVPMVVRAVAPVPVLAAGGVADGAGLAAALILGAEGALLGTRFLATSESPFPESFKRAILESDGHNTLLTEVPDVMNARVWPGAFSRVARNALIEAWIGREGELRRRRREVAARARQARERGDVDGSVLAIGQSAGLITDLPPASALVRRIVREAESLLRDRAREVLEGSR